METNQNSPVFVATAWAALALTMLVVLELLSAEFAFQQQNDHRFALVHVIDKALANIGTSSENNINTAAQPKKKLDQRALLPNYPDKGWSEQLYRELARLSVEYRPFLGWRRKPFAGKLATISKDGYRVHPVDANDWRDAKVIGLFGGSTVWSTGVDDANTLAALLDYKSPKFKVRNFGESGFNARQNLIQLVNLINIDEKPDVAIFYEGVNDVYAGCIEENKSRNTHIREGDIARKLDKITKKNPRRFLCHKDKKRAEQVADMLLSNWRHAHTLAKANGIRFIAVLQPVAYLGTATTSHLKLNNHVGLQYQAVYPIMKRKIARIGADWIFDRTDILNFKGYIYIDFCHVSKNGNALVADELAKVMHRHSVSEN